MMIKMDDLWRDLVQKHTRGGACNFRNAAFEYAGEAMKQEREACAKVCDEIGDGYMQQARGGDSSGASDHKACAAAEISDAIRALSSERS